MMQIVVHQPSYAEETEIAARMDVRPPEAERVLDTGDLIKLQTLVDDIFVHHAVRDYAVRLVMATRDPVQWGVPDIAPHIALGASPRATLGLLAAGRALALLRGRRYLVPQDVFDVAPEILRHRLVLSYEALADGVDADFVVNRVLSTVLAPRIAPSQERRTVAAQPVPAPSPMYPEATRWQDSA
jgi:MoxR-like ATPase